MNCKSILIVEDDQGIRSSLEEFFVAEGYPVLLAENGQEALDLLTGSVGSLPSLILLDKTMPQMDGPTFLLELEREHPKTFAEIPIFMVTAGGDFQKQTFKVTGYLKKPFDLDELSKVASQYCSA